MKGSLSTVKVTIVTFSTTPLEPRMSHTPSRREFIIKVASVSAAVTAGASLSACGGSSAQPEFLYGVASGDPLATQVILWTHAKYPGYDSPVALQYQVALDAAFTQIVSQGTVEAKSDTGFTAKVDATGLLAGTSYFYRFVSGTATSPVGRTRTLPTTATSLKLAVMSCSNYPAGFFNVYSEVANSDAEYALHLGDYIYEYAATGYASTTAATLGRVSAPANEILTLSDYRLRHAQYKSDPDSKNLHALKPMIAVWDDHETANDAYKDGAENHTPATEGSWAARRAAGLQAYHEWMPIRTGSDRAKIYRSFDFGKLVSLHMLDTRLIGRDQQVAITDLLGLKGAAAQDAAFNAITSDTRQLLGKDQMDWLTTQMANSTATWQVLGQQVLMARMEFPASTLAALNSTDTSAAAQAAGNKAVTDYIVAKNTPASLRTPAQTDLMDTTKNPKVGYNLDAWDGYPVTREILLSTALQLKKNLVVLAGDTHNAWHSHLTLKGGIPGGLPAGTKAGEEFATGSVSSPGLEEYLVTLKPAEIKGIFEGVIDDLKWMDASQRGYLKMTFTANEAKGEWFFVNTITNRTFTSTLGKTVTMNSAVAS
jgi:alkaline phosphatase D